MLYTFDHGIMSAVQSLYGVLGELGDRLFLAATFLGEETLAFMAVFVIYWCISKRCGEYIVFAVYCAIACNGILKDAISRPRPFLNGDYADMRYVIHDGPLVDTASLGASYSFPSGHSQTAAVIFGAIAAWLKKPAVWIAALLLTLGVMTSRVYLGVHYPTDTLAGAALGLAFALICHRLYERYYEKRLLLMTAAVALSLTGLLGNCTVDTVKTIGLGIGAVAGIALEHTTLDFSVGGSLPRRALRLALGLALIMAVRGGLKPLLPDTILFHGLRYAAVGFTAMYLWPLIFTKCKL